LNEKKTVESNKRSDVIGQAHKSDTSAAQPENASNSRNATKNITRMVIFHTLLNITGTFPIIVYNILNYGKLVSVTSQQFNDFYNVAVIIIYGAPGLNIFIYYFFNKLYREVFRGYLKKIFFFIS
jgi:hypothetical protein